jgi:hypothetical protein
MRTRARARTRLSLSARLAQLAYYVSHWSKQTMPALFLKHEGYSGALGAFLFSAGLDASFGAEGGVSSDEHAEEGSEGEAEAADAHDASAAKIVRSRASTAASGGQRASAALLADAPAHELAALPPIGPPHDSDCEPD